MREVKEDTLRYILNAVKSQPSENLESEQIEFKQYSSMKSFVGDNELIKEISAFANTKGGAIILGVVDNEKKIKGVWPNQLEGFLCDDYDQAKERLVGKLSAPLNLEVVELEFEGKYYTVIHIPRSHSELIGSASGRFCKRVGRSSLPLTGADLSTKVKHLHSFDWTDEIVTRPSHKEIFDAKSVIDAYRDYLVKRSLTENEVTVESYLESIGALSDGHATRAGILFLGREDELRKHFGVLEFRVTQREKSGKLLINEVWSDNIWNSLQITGELFLRIRKDIDLEYKDRSFQVTNVDAQAFHEAYLNAIVHRDYNIEGMITVDFSENHLKISSPGTFYGGITVNNIGVHDPRHRNRRLANLLMKHNFVDRAGAGVYRMGVGSLRFGRTFPTFQEDNSSVSVVMQLEFLNPVIFITYLDHENDLSLVDLYVLNILVNENFVGILDLEKRLARATRDPWLYISHISIHPVLSKYVELVGNYSGVYLTVSSGYFDVFGCTRRLKTTQASFRHVAIYSHLRSVGKDSVGNITKVIGYSNVGTTGQFLKKCKYLSAEGISRDRNYFLA